MVITVYSAVYGGYDQLNHHPVKPTLFTEIDGGLNAEAWDVKEVKVPGMHPRMKAKYFKCNPHECLPGHDISIWIDGSATIHDPNFVERCVKYLGKADMMAFTHPTDRKCIYEEAAFCRDFPKYRDHDILGQVEAYRQAGHPENDGLWACGLLVRRNNEAMRNFNQSWWLENCRYTYQDQLSFPFLVRKTGINLKTLWLNQLDNDLITFNTPHTHDK